MLFALGAMSSAMDALQSLTGSKSSPAQRTGFNPAAANPFDIDAGSSAGSSASTSAPAAGTTGNGISPQTMSALLAAQSQSPDGQASSTPTSRSAALKDLFSLIDADGDGQISKSEFENALGAGGTNLAQADSVFGKLDANGDGSVSLKEMGNALRGRGHHHPHAGGAGGANGAGSDGSNSDPLLQALDGASSTAVTNSDGSTTTTITYADGSKVSMTTPAASSTSNGSSTSGAAASSYSWIEQMIQREAKMLSASAASSSVSLTA